MSLIPSRPFNEARALEYFNRTVTDALAVGLTSVHDAMSLPEEINFYKKCAKAFFSISRTNVLQTFRDYEAACQFFVCSGAAVLLIWVHVG